MLRLKNITKDYGGAGNTVHALKGISLDFRKNEFVSILGQSGCGKTTLLNIIGGLDKYTSGDLEICGVSTKNFTDGDWDVYRNHRIGFVFQSYNLIPHQTILGNVEIALTIAGVSKAERKKRAAEALKRVGLEKEMNKKPNQLSGGQMQRVAIARALVNSPEILLADEPTGALDSATSVQIMELIREIAGERLVIMVTHNPELAEKYSSRIVQLSDGRVVSDSNPYDADEERKGLLEAVKAKNLTDEEISRKLAAFRAEKKAKRKQGGKKREKAAMSFGTSLGLSARNLKTKKGRTTLTSVAGSIGIISVCLVLALSNGFNSYIRKTEENMLSRYPLQITETSVDFSAVMTGMSTRAEDLPDLSKIGDQVYVDSFVTKIAGGMTVKNDISDEYLAYVAAMDDKIYNAVSYDFGESYSDNLFTDVQVGATEAELHTEYRSLSSLKQFYTDELTKNAEQYKELAGMVNMLGAVVSKMPGTSDFSDARYGEYVLSQYNIVAGEFPEKENECVLVIGRDNTAIDLLMAQLGFIEETKFLTYFDNAPKDGTVAGKDPEASKLIPYSTLLSKRYTLYYNDAVYKENAPSDTYPFTYSGVRTGADANLDAADGAGVQLTVKGILKLKDGLDYGCLQKGLNVTESLAKKFVEENKKSAIVKWVNEKSNIKDSVNELIDLHNAGVPDGQKLARLETDIYRSPAQHLNDSYVSGEIMKNYFPSAGVGSAESGMLDAFLKDKYFNVSVDKALQALSGSDKVRKISVYPSDFDTKAKVISYLDAWNDSHDTAQKVTYTDTVGTMMSMVQTMLNAVTYVLVAFTGISLVVSSVMIGIITYVSVVERTKEIGVLRSLGARKKDIRHLFNAETFLIGLFAGTFGVAVTYLLSLPINRLLKRLTGVGSLAALPFGQGLLMIAVSVALTLISGLIPASSAAKKDPVVALRTE